MQHHQGSCLSKRLQALNAEVVPGLTQPSTHGQVVAPEGYLTVWATRKPLTCATYGGDKDFGHIAFGDFYAIRFDQRIDGKRSPAFTLARAAVAAVYDHRLGGHFIAHVPTCTSTLKRAIPFSHALTPSKMRDAPDRGCEETNRNNTDCINSTRNYKLRQ